MRVPGSHAMDVGALGDIPGPDAERRVTTRQRRSSRSPDAPSTSGATAALRTQTGHVTSSGRDGHRSTGSSKKGMFLMNFKDKRTRRINAACASAAVVMGGATVGATLASAGGALTITGGVTDATTLDLVAAVSAGGLTAALPTATYAVNVSTAVTGARELTFDSYTAPSGITYAGTPHLFYRKQ